MQGTLRINNRVAWSKLVLQKELKGEGLPGLLRVREGCGKAFWPAWKEVCVKAMRWQRGSEWLELRGVK